MTYQIGDKAWYTIDDTREPVQISAIYLNEDEAIETLYDLDHATDDRGWGEIAATQLESRSENVADEIQHDNEILEMELPERLGRFLRETARANGNSPSQEMLRIMREHLDANPA